MIGLAFLLVAASAKVNGDQKILDRISMSCGLSSGDITIKQGKLVRIRPSGTPSYQSLECTLPKLRRAGFTYPAGFISQPSTEPKH